MPSVLFVCTANRCRSPVAEALLKNKVKNLALASTWQIESAGTWAVEGLPAIEPTRLLLKERGIDISSHRSRVITAELLAAFRLTLVMESGQKEALQIEFPSMAKRIFMLSEMCHKMHDIKDPTGSSPELFVNLIEEIESYINQGFNRIIRLSLPVH